VTTAQRQRVVAATLLIVAAIGVWWLQVHNRRLAESVRNEIYVPKPEKITPEIVLLQQYVRIDTSNPPGKELAGARWLSDRLARNGVHAEIIESAPGRASVYARLKGKQQGEGLLLLSHIDVVPVDPTQWERPPFGATILINNVWGRGTLDMKGITICELEAFIAAYRRGRVPERDVVFLATADEEQGSKLGLLWLIDHRPDVLEGIRYAINEGGVTETLKEELTYFGIEIGSKQVVSLLLLGPSRDQMRRARIALEPSFISHEPERVLPEVRRYFHEIASRRIEDGPLLVNIDRTIADGKFWLIPRTYRELLQNTVFVEGAARLGAGWMMKTHLVNLPDELPERRLAWLESVVEPFGVTIGPIQQSDGPVPLTSADTPFFALMRKEIQRVYGNVPVGTTILSASINDSRFLRKRGIACYGVWPFPVDLYQTRGIHGINERIRLDWFQQGVTLTRNLVGSYAFER
jgi:acetylornithine deacetylase/succinyl-diaminopimelate desuccinylase-like protein